MAYSVCMTIQWDASKNEANRRKHGLSFEEAQVLFSSEQEYLELFDEAHSVTEDRFISIGPIERGLVAVVWTERDEDILRIISARWATAHEKELYRRYMEREQ